jgi:hypothetical protein
MPDTIVHTAEEVADGTIAGLAGAVGGLTNETAHHAEALAAHTERLTNIESDTTWIKTRLEDLAQMVTAVPSTAIGELREDLAALRHDLTAQMAALSEATEVPETQEEPQTEPPPPQTNEAVPKKRGGLLGALHRLL